MSYEDDGGAAFPTSDTNSYRKGMTIRDYFAAQAMTGMLSNPSTKVDSNDVIKSLSGVCYDIADAMLEERARDPNPRRVL